MVLLAPGRECKHIVISILGSATTGSWRLVYCRTAAVRILFLSPRARLLSVVESDMTAPEQTPRPKPTATGAKNRYLLLDHWRGVACLMIVVLHATHCAKEGL